MFLIISNLPLSKGVFLYYTNSIWILIRTLWRGQLWCYNSLVSTCTFFYVINLYIFVSQTVLLIEMPKPTVRAYSQALFSQDRLKSHIYSDIQWGSWYPSCVLVGCDLYTGLGWINTCIVHLHTFASQFELPPIKIHHHRCNPIKRFLPEIPKPAAGVG